MGNWKGKNFPFRISLHVVKMTSVETSLGGKMRRNLLCLHLNGENYAGEIHLK